jgi:hypothetical protein
VYLVSARELVASTPESVRASVQPKGSELESVSALVPVSAHQLLVPVWAGELVQQESVHQLLVLVSVPELVQQESAHRL